MIEPEKLQELLDHAAASGEENALGLCIFQHGKCVAFLNAGKGIGPETLFPVFSVGKGIVTTGIHMLMERGLLSCDTRISDLWPEFGKNGKKEIRLWQILSHRTGLHPLPPYGEPENLADWRMMCSLMEEATPVFAPGTRSAYQGITFAWLAGETANRVLGGEGSFQEFIHENILKPLGIQREFFFGTDDEAEKRLILPDPPDMSEPPSILGSIRLEKIRRGFIPSMNGFATARAIARHYAALSPEGVDGVRLLKPETVSAAVKLCRDLTVDPIPKSGTWAKFGLGYVLAGPPENPGSLFGHGGALGAEGLCSFPGDLALGFVKNHRLPTHPVHPVRDRISEALGLPIRHW